MLPLIETAQTALKANPLLAGGAGMAAVGWLLMQAKQLPGRIWSVAKEQFSATLTIYNEDDIFSSFSLWLARHPSAKHSRNLTLASRRNNAKERTEYELTPGPGLHLLRDGLRFYLVHREVEENVAKSTFAEKRRQTIHITTFGRSRQPLVDLVRDVHAVEEDTTSIPVNVWTGYDFQLVERRQKRSLDTILIDPKVKAEIVRDMRWFMSARADYNKRCQPYRRGYLLEGPRGTGKTSLIFALASEFNLPVFIINLSGIDSDTELLKAMNHASSGVVVFEDIDASGVQVDRPDGEASDAPRAGLDARTAGITLSGLLNATDGIATKEGRILFMTTNHPDRLDSALVRPGRCDREFHLGLADAPIAERFADLWFDPPTAKAFCAEIAGDLPMPPADLQGRLMVKFANYANPDVQGVD